MVCGFGDMGEYNLAMEELKRIALEKLIFLGGEFQSMEETQEENLETLTKSEINNPLMRKIEEEGYREIYLLSLIDNQYVLRIVLQSMDMEDQGRITYQNYIRIQINDEGNYQNIQHLTNLLYASIDMPMKNGISAHIVAYYDEQLSTKEQENTIRKVLRAVDCSDVDITKSEYEISGTGYSPYLGEGLQIGDSSLNIQAIIRNNYYKGKTQLLIVTPMLTTEF